MRWAAFRTARLAAPGALAAVFAAGALWSGTLPATAQNVDIKAIFNCDAGGPLGPQSPEQCAASRDTVLSACTSCHSFVPIVKAQKNEDAWNATLTRHRTKVQGLTDDQFEQLQLFLVSHFNETLPPPKLPPALEALGLPAA